MNTAQAAQTSDDAALAVVLRQTQWILDDAAHGLPTGRFPTDKRRELASVLESLAVLLHESAGHVVIDSADHAELFP